MKQIPEPSRRRLVTLAALLSQQQVERITSVTLSALTGWSQSLIRRDIALLEVRAGVSNGYDVRLLRSAICAALHIGVVESDGGADAHDERGEAHRCCIVGLGRLGVALLDGGFFSGTPFRVVAGFDASMNRTEVLRSVFPLYPASELETVVVREGIEYALLAVPDGSAQATAERLTASGIRGIVNYTGAVLSVAVPVENVAPVTALSHLLAQRVPMDFRGAVPKRIE